MALIRQTAHVRWEGTIARGQGEVRGDRALPPLELSQPVRLGEEEGPATTPEELLAAAHAGCFTMTLGSTLARERTPPQELEVEATCTLDTTQGQRHITGIHLEVRGRVPGADAEAFESAVRHAEQQCVVSRALAVPITSRATLL